MHRLAVFLSVELKVLLMKINVLLPFVLVAIIASPTFAGFIDFESGFAETDIVSTINTGDNVVTFVTGTGSPLPTTYRIAERGSPREAFVPDDLPDPDIAGDFFLTDEEVMGDGSLNGPGNYGMSFATPILSLSLLTMDYRADGGGAVGDTVTLNLFTASDFTGLVASDFFTITGAEVDGIVTALSVVSDMPVRSAMLTHSGRDVGTAIDNIRFESVPEPGSVVSLLCGLGICLSGLRRRK